jgi:hypothetical protein
MLSNEAWLKHIFYIGYYKPISKLSRTYLGLLVSRNGGKKGKFFNWIGVGQGGVKTV